MSWNYALGDNPGQALYSLHAFASYLAGAFATVRNLDTNLDETWFAPSTSNPGGIIRRVLPTDTSIHQDMDLSGAATPISSLYETALLPLGQDQNQTTVHDFHGMHARISGQGSLALTCYGLDHVRSLVPMASPITLTQQPGLELLLKWFMRSEQQSISFGMNAVDAYFLAALLRVYWTPSMQQRGGSTLPAPPSPFGDQYFTAVDGQTTFTATFTLTQNSLVWMNRLLQHPGAAYDYTITGNTVMFTFPLVSGDTVEIIQ